MRRGTIAILLGGALMVFGCGDDSGSGDEGAGTSSSGTETPTTGTPSTTGGVESTSSSSTGTPDATTGGAATTSSTDPGTTSGSEEDGSSTTTGAVACEGMSFFATSEGSGKAGGNLGGLEGADATCQSLADAAGQGACTWQAYLSTSTVDARDRIGTGPWENFAGEVIADSVEALHADGLSNGDPQHMLDETGSEVPSNEHDILTGSNEDGTYLLDSTCLDWTSDSSDDIAQVGHSDIPGNPNFSPSWNAAHLSNGCSQQNLQGTGGSGRLYCFAL